MLRGDEHINISMTMGTTCCSALLDWKGLKDFVMTRGVWGFSKLLGIGLTPFPRRLGGVLHLTGGTRVEPTLCVFQILSLSLETTLPS